MSSNRSSKKSKSKSKSRPKSTKKYSKTKTATKKSRNKSKSKRKSKAKAIKDISSSSEDELLPDKDGRFNCEDCGKSYKQMSSLQRHIKKTHTMETTKCHQCQYCDASFFSKYQLTVHKFSNAIIP